MSYPLTNLGDYNVARDALKAAGGSWEVLYNRIGVTAVAKAAPKYLLQGGCIGAVFIGLLWAGYEIKRLLKERKLLIENEPALKKKFSEAVEEESLMRTEEHTCDIE